MMRAFFFVLLLANVAFLAYAYFSGPPGTRDSGATVRQITPERIRLLTSEQAAAAAARANAASPVCFEWGAVAASDATRAIAALEAVVKGAKVVERRVDEPTGWWVYIPPLGRRQAANQRYAELRKQGIEDVSLLAEDSRFADAVSLGVFSSEDAAAKRLEALKKRGLRDPVMAPRESTATKVFLQARDVPSDLRPRVVELAAAFPGTDVRECPR
jgi:hypothetical protein